MNRHTLALLTALTLSGCEELDPFLPTVSFDDLDVEHIDFDGAEVDFVFQVDNPNPIEIGLSSFSYGFDLADTPLLSGDDEDGFQLEASGGSALRLPVALRWQDVWQTVQATRGLDVVGFGLDGHFGFDTPAGEARLPYAERGDFPAVRTPKFRLANLRAKRFNLLQNVAELELDIGVDNEHASSLFFDRFDYGLQIEGLQLAGGSLNTFEVDGDHEGTLTLPIQIDLLNAGTGLVSALSSALGSGGNLDVGLDATMDVDTPFGVLPLTVDETGALSVVDDR